MSLRYKHPMGTFRRGLNISPFQIPILAYLMIEGLLSIPAVPFLVDELDLERSWPVWNYIILLTVGSALGIFSRFNGNERQESFSLYLVSLAVAISVWVQISAGEYGLGGEVAIFLGCMLRNRVLSRSRKAEKMAIEIVNDNEGETP